MHCSNHNVSRAFFTLMSLSAFTIAVLLFTLHKGYDDFENKGTISMPDERKSIDTIEDSLRDFISSADLLLSKIANVVKGNAENISHDSHSITRALTHMRWLVSETESRLKDSEIRSFLSQPVINNHNFSYIHNRVDTCSENKINVLLVLPSAPANFEKRQKARNDSRGDYVQNATNNAKMLFFLGRPSQSQNYTNIQQKIDEEVKQFGDIVQEDFEDIYDNNRLKSVSMLRWASTYCNNTKYVIRSDDDVTVNVSALMFALDRTAETLDNFIIGRKRVEDIPARNLGDKYYLSEKEYPPPTFPPYLLGGLLGYPVSTARLLYEAALRVKPIWLEDVFITGLCAPKVHVPVLTDSEFVFKH